MIRSCRCGARFASLDITYQSDDTDICPNTESILEGKNFRKARMDRSIAADLPADILVGRSRL
jgi:hypothetical protein